MSSSSSSSSSSTSSASSASSASSTSSTSGVCICWDHPMGGGTMNANTYSAQW